MLVLSRKKGESIQIGNDVIITVVRFGRSRVRVGIEAPEELKILRRELEERDEPNNAKEN